MTPAFVARVIEPSDLTVVDAAQEEFGLAETQVLSTRDLWPANLSLPWTAKEKREVVVEQLAKALNDQHQSQPLVA